MPVVAIGPDPVAPTDVVAVARHGAPVALSDAGRRAMAASRARVEELAAGDGPVYGVSTGFGALAARHIPAPLRAQLQHAVVRSHAAGMGPSVEPEVVRAMMLLRARTLATGYCGARPIVAESLVALLNEGVTPAVPEYGSLGCSGDLAPLAHVAMALIDRGLELTAKEGLSLINGTDGMLGMLVLACHDAQLLFRTADVTAALAVEGLLGTDRVFRSDLQRLRPHPGQAASAANITRLLAGSPLVASHRRHDRRVQDAYSVRCAPQVAGAARDTLAFAEQTAARELASAIDNPVVLPDGTIESNGNFHGVPLAFACDFLAIAAAEVGAIAERRIDRMLDVTRSHGLPPFLAHDPGVDSGLMIAHYTAAAMVAENRRLAAPASVDSLPTSAMQEDHVSMGWAAARKLRLVLANLARVLAVELVTGVRAVKLREPLAPAAATGAVCELVCSQVGGPGPDRFLAPELARAEELVMSGAVVEGAETALGGRLQ
ncbi:MAG: histidine ammonia-lyase [Actinomycetota bacterium]|nr:histidine ammonia-lyase [Actinomycetota bacterium]MDQ6946138.1 histidine ammonia-lyase [Actinomycetota bacterium]